MALKTSNKNRKKNPFKADESSYKYLGVFDESYMVR